VRDADEIERFFLETIGMQPGYLQLSRGLADLRLRVVEIGGVLVWCHARGKARWLDQMTGGALHFGFAVERDGPITIRGHDVAAVICFWLSLMNGLEHYYRWKRRYLLKVFRPQISRSLHY